MREKAFDIQGGADTGISVITCTNRPSFIENIFDNYDRQEYQPREMIILLNNNAIDFNIVAQQAKEHQEVTVYQLDESWSLGDCYNFGVARCKYQYIAKLDDDDYYGSYYLSDPMKAFRYTEADIVGKHGRFVYFEGRSLLMLYDGIEYDYVSYVVGATMVFKRLVWEKVKFQSITLGEDSEFQATCLDHGFKIFSIDKYNYATIRRKDTLSHTFQMDDNSYMVYCTPVAYTDHYIPLVIR